MNGFSLVVVFIDVGLDCYDEFFYIAADTAPPQPVLSEITEDAPPC